MKVWAKFSCFRTGSRNMLLWTQWWTSRYRSRIFLDPLIPTISNDDPTPWCYIALLTLTGTLIISPLVLNKRGAGKRKRRNYNNKLLFISVTYVRIFMRVQQLLLSPLQNSSVSVWEGPHLTSNMSGPLNDLTLTYSWRQHTGRPRTTIYYPDIALP